MFGLFDIIGFFGGVVVATVVWFFVLRNNKKTFMNILQDGWFEASIDQIEDLGEDLRDRIILEFDKFKERF